MKIDIDDNTIMPDGRPFFAWKNELEMLRQQSVEAENKYKNATGMAEAMKIIEFIREPDEINNDFVLRIRMVDTLDSFSSNPIDIVNRLLSKKLDEQKQQILNLESMKEEEVTATWREDCSQARNGLRDKIKQEIEGKI